MVAQMNNAIPFVWLLNPEKSTAIPYAYHDGKWIGLGGRRL